MFNKFLLFVFVFSLFYTTDNNPSNISTPYLNNTCGKYILIKANNQKLPATVNSSGDQEVIGGFVLLNSDKTHRWETIYRYTEKDGKVRTSKSSGTGRYSIKGDRIIFGLDRGDTRLPATLKGEVLVLQADVELIYKKKP